MRQHRVIRRERAQDVAGEEHAGNVRWVANRDTRLPTVTSETRNPWAMSGRMPTTTKSLMPSTKLDAISVTAGSVKKRSLPCRPRMAEPDMTVPLLLFLLPDGTYISGTSCRARPPSPADEPGGPARTGAGDASLNPSYNGHPYRGGYGHVQSKSDRKPGGATKRQRRSWVAVIAIIVFALGSNLVSHIISTGGSSDSDDSSHSFKSPSQDNKPTRVKTGETTSFSNRKATVTIAKATTGPTDYDGHKTVIITYHWKNTGDANTTFGELAMDLQAYQSGIGLNKTYLHSRGGSSIEGHKTQSNDIKIAKGEESDATIAYQLNDATGDLYVIANQATRYHEGIMSAFKAPTSGTQYEQVQPDDIAPAPKSTEAEKRKMKRISSYSGTPSSPSTT